MSSPVPEGKEMFAVAVKALDQSFEWNCSNLAIKAPEQPQ